MSRSLERVGPTAHADNTFATAFTVPNGHKYEVVQASLGLSGAGGSTVAQLINLATAPSFVDGTLATPANPVTWRFDSQGFVLYAGETWDAGVFGNGAAWTLTVVYVDVAYT